MKTVAVQMGTNAIACEACEEINVLRRREVAHGTCFVAVTGEHMARLRSGETTRVTLLCHEHKHINTFALTA